MLKKFLAVVMVLLMTLSMVTVSPAEVMGAGAATATNLPIEAPVVTYGEGVASPTFPQGDVTITALPDGTLVAMVGDQVIPLNPLTFAELSELAAPIAPAPEADAEVQAGDSETDEADEGETGEVSPDVTENGENQSPEETGDPTDTETPEETEVPVEPDLPAETEAPAETEEPVETEAPAETEEPVETEAPAETEEPAETEVPTEMEDPAVPDAGAMAYKLLKEFVDSHNPGRSIQILYSLNGKADVGMGDDIFFNALLKGYDGLVYSLQWQYTTNGTDWTNIAGANAPTYRLTVSEATIDWTVRVNVLISGGDGFNMPTEVTPDAPADEAPAVQPAVPDQDDVVNDQDTPAAPAPDQDVPAAESVAVPEEAAPAPAPEG